MPQALPATVPALQQQHPLAEHGLRQHASTAPAAGVALPTVPTVPADPEAVFLRAFTAAPLVRWALERRPGDGGPRKPSSMPNVERRWFVG